MAVFMDAVQLKVINCRQNSIAVRDQCRFIILAQTCATETSDPGTACVTPVTRWYLNTQTNRCTTFTYNGCDGNSNNFATQIDCQDYCNVGGINETLAFQRLYAQCLSKILFRLSGRR